jgi:hypothetical protein
MAADCLLIHPSAIAMTSAASRYLRTLIACSFGVRRCTIPPREDVQPTGNAAGTQVALFAFVEMSMNHRFVVSYHSRLLKHKN